MSNTINLDLIKSIREQHNFKQADIADKLCMSRSAYTKKENGHRDFRRGELVRLARLFSTSVESFYYPLAENTNSINPNNLEALVASMILDLRIEHEKQTSLAKYRGRPDCREMNYAEYMEQKWYESTIANVLEAIEDYPELIEDHVEWNRKEREQMKKSKFYNFKITYDGTPMYMWEVTPKWVEYWHAGDQHPNHPAFDGEFFEYIKDKSELWISEWCKDERNFNHCWALIGWPHVEIEYEDEEPDVDQAFLEDHPYAKILIRYGLIESSTLRNKIKQPKEDGKEPNWYCGQRNKSTFRKELFSSIYNKYDLLYALLNESAKNANGPYY